MGPPRVPRAGAPSAPTTRRDLLAGAAPCAAHPSPCRPPPATSTFRTSLSLPALSSGRTCDDVPGGRRPSRSVRLQSMRRGRRARPVAVMSCSATTRPPEAPLNHARHHCPLLDMRASLASPVSPPDIAHLLSANRAAGLKRRRRSRPERCHRRPLPRTLTTNPERRRPGKAR